VSRVMYQTYIIELCNLVIEHPSQSAYPCTRNTTQTLRFVYRKYILLQVAFLFTSLSAKS